MRFQVLCGFIFLHSGAVQQTHYSLLLIIIIKHFFQYSRLTYIKTRSSYRHLNSFSGPARSLNDLPPELAFKKCKMQQHLPKRMLLLADLS